ncbi:MAG: hypothetical protein F4074_05480, partial [Synechococcus sp. SB0672_bin_10]|nr:hypothetical protein [Synechococcus sp. SB0672_bin_10]
MNIQRILNIITAILSIGGFIAGTIFTGSAAFLPSALQMLISGFAMLFLATGFGIVLGIIPIILRKIISRL